jgi:hypothetical protein
VENEDALRQHPKHDEKPNVPAADAFNVHCFPTTAESVTTWKSLGDGERLRSETTERR